MPAMEVTWSVAWRSMRLIPRLPSTFIPSLVMPIFFVVAFSGAYAGLVAMPGFPARQMLDWILPMSTLQGCAFAGITTGMGLARDMENGFYDRLIGSPAPRIALVAGPLLASMMRASIPFVMLSVVGLAAGVNVPGGPAAFAMLAIAALGVSFVAGGWACGVAFRAKTQQAAPLMQMVLFLAFFLSTAMMPVELLTGWVHAAARVNPMTNILALGRQGFIGDISWAQTWPGLLAIGALGALLGLFAYRGLRTAID